jgi:hypothetical protein
MLGTNEDKNAARLSVLRNKTWMGKKFFRGDDGGIQKQSNGLFTNGIVRSFDVPNAIQLANLIAKLKPTDALCLGVHNAGSNTVRASTRSKSVRIRDSGIQCIARTKDHFSFHDGEGWLLIDFDDKDLPQKINERIDANGGTYAVLLQLWPELVNGDFLIKPSSSAGVHSPDTEPAIASGFHMFVRIKNARAIPQTLQALHALCWDTGYGYHLISKSGQQLDRSLIDVSVGSPERLIFTADPILGEGILRTPPPMVQQDGIALSALKMPLSSEWSRLRDIDRQRSSAEALRVRLKFMDQQAERHVREFGGTLSHARAVVTSRVQGRVLRDADVLDTVSAGMQSVGSILDTMAQGKILACADPIEGRSYNPTAAAILWQSNQKFPVLISHAHGLQTVYRFERFLSGGQLHG